MTGRKQARILVVDDNAAFCENLEEILLDEGYSVRTAHSCQSALADSAEGFEIALVDLRLPDGEGTMLAARLTEQSADSEVIMLTGFATVESAAAAVRAGAAAYLVKPCSTPELLLTLEQTLRKVRLKQEKRELARRAQVAEKLAAVGTLMAGLSHEIRNPLNGATLQLTVLQRRIAKLPEETRAGLNEPLTLVQDEIRRLDHILEDFLQFARPRDLEKHPVGIDTVLGQVVEFLSAQAAARHVRVACECPPGVRVAGDGDRLRQVFINLILNAIDAADHDGWVRLSCVRTKDGQVQITVEDSGPGIPPPVRERIFEPFFTTKAGGSGLGLPIVRAIVLQHGGSLSVQTATGGGAAFVVSLPEATSATPTPVPIPKHGS